MTPLKLKNINASMQKMIAIYLQRKGYRRNEIQALLLNADINQKPLDYLKLKCPKLFDDEKLKSNLRKNFH